MSWRAQHFADAHNREELNRAIAKIPAIISSPRTIADEADRERNKLIGHSKESHEGAELAWTSYRRWRLARNIAVGISAIALICGMGWPLSYLTLGGKLAP
ncbi:hypothetical protein [Bradyrhizobium sp. USDA 4454]